MDVLSLTYIFDCAMVMLSNNLKLSGRLLKSFPHNIIGENSLTLACGEELNCLFKIWIPQESRNTKFANSVSGVDKNSNPCGKSQPPLGINLSQWLQKLHKHVSRDYTNSAFVEKEYNDFLQLCEN